MRVGDRVRCINGNDDCVTGAEYRVTVIDGDLIGIDTRRPNVATVFASRFVLVDDQPVVEAPVGEEVTVYLITAYRNETTIHATHPSPEAANSWIRSAENLNYTILKKQKITFNL